MIIRSYHDQDYPQVLKLYNQNELYGGQFDKNRDSRKRLKDKILSDHESILVAEDNKQIVGTVSIIDDGRVAWLFRFCVTNDQDKKIAEELFNKARETLKKRGHKQVLVYSPTKIVRLSDRYEMLGFNKGNDYTCFWKDL